MKVYPKIPRYDHPVVRLHRSRRVTGQCGGCGTFAGGGPLAVRSLERDRLHAVSVWAIYTTLPAPIGGYRTGYGTTETEGSIRTSELSGGR